MIHMETEQREEDNYRLRKELGASAQGLDVGMPPPVIMLAGNKCDLKEGRVIGAKEGLEYARKHGCGFMETSAREMVNIEETFARKCYFLPPTYLFISMQLMRTPLVLVRRVAEARRTHYSSDSATGTATKPAPATSETQGEHEKTANPEEQGSRWSKFFQKSKDGRRSLWRRLLCC